MRDGRRSPMLHYTIESHVAWVKETLLGAWWPKSAGNDRFLGIDYSISKNLVASYISRAML